jgi:hypothetical protein
MNAGQILSELSPSWWVQQNSLWNTTFLSTVILFNTEALTGCTYTSSAPIQSFGLNTAPSAPVDQLDTFTEHLMQEAAQRLADMGCVEVTGHEDLAYVYNATA